MPARIQLVILARLESASSRSRSASLKVEGMKEPIPMRSEGQTPHPSSPVAASGVRSSKLNPPETNRARVVNPTRAANNKFFTMPEIAELLIVSERTVWRWIEREKLIAHHFGGATRIIGDELIGFIAGARRGAAPLQPANPLADNFYTVKEVAEMLNVCIRTVRRHIKSKALAAYNFGRIRIGDTDLRDFADRSRRE